MGVYEFEVLKDGAAVAARQTIALPDISAAWMKIVELANTFDEPDHKFRVKDETGGIDHPSRRCHPSPLHQCGLICSAMTNGTEKTLIEALRKVAVHGDVAPASRS